MKVAQTKVAKSDRVTGSPSRRSHSAVGMSVLDQRPDTRVVQRQVALAQQGPFAQAQARQIQVTQRRRAGLPAPAEVQRMAAATAPSPHTTALPGAMRRAMEQLSGLDLGTVQVHHNSPQPAALGALAYAQGRDIHLAPGQAEHLPHEAWHVVQQGQGRVRASSQIAGQPANTDAVLERDADTMGTLASQARSDIAPAAAQPALPAPAPGVLQGRLPPSGAIEREVHLGAGPASASLHLLRLLHMEHSAGRLVRAADQQPYASADDALADVFVDDRFDAPAYRLLYAANARYSQVLAPDQALSDVSWARLQPGLVRASFLAVMCSRRVDDIEDVFGPNARVAEIVATYRRVSARLAGFGRANFVVDYHNDDVEVGVGGSTSPGSARIRISPALLAEDANTLAVLLLHEGCHEVDATIIDKGYYGTPSFDTLSKASKQTNAAHYEEVARRANGNSRYAGLVFVPVAQQLVQGGGRAEVTRKSRAATEGLRRLWALSYGMHRQLRELASGTSTVPADQQATRIGHLKTAFSLPAAPPGARRINELDLALSEAHVRVLNRAQDAAERFRRERDPARRLLLVAMSVKQMALEAILRVGGFQGLDPAINETAVNQIREVAIMVFNLADPFPEMGED